MIRMNFRKMFPGGGYTVVLHPCRFRMFMIAHYNVWRNLGDSMKPKPEKLLDQMRRTIRLKHYSYHTEKQYIHWIRRFILFHNKQHPASMGRDEIEAFLTHLAIDRKVAASTQNQALHALLFLYKSVLEAPFDERHLMSAWMPFAPAVQNISLPCLPEKRLCCCWIVCTAQPG